MNPIKIKLTLDKSELRQAEQVGKETGQAIAKGVKAGSAQINADLTSRLSLIKENDARLKQLAERHSATMTQARQAVRSLQQEERAREQMAQKAERAAKRQADAELRETRRASEARIREMKRAQEASEKELAKSLRIVERMEADAIKKRNAQVANSLGGGTGRGSPLGRGGAVAGAALASFGGGGTLATAGGAIGGALGLSLPALGGIIAALTIIDSLIEKGINLVTRWVEVWFEYRTVIERAKLGLSVFLGDTQAASGFVQNLIKELRGLGDLDSALVLSRRLLNVGLSAQEATQRVKELTTISVGLGLNEAEQKGASKALSDVVTAGKLRGQEVLQFNNAGIGIRKLLADQLSLSQSEVQNLQKKGKISAEMVLKAISDYAARFQPIMEKALDLPQVSQKRIEQSLGRLGDMAFGAFYEFGSKQLRKLADTLENAQTFEEAANAAATTFSSIGGNLAGNLIAGFVMRLQDPNTYAALIQFAANANTAFMTGILAGIGQQLSKSGLVRSLFGIKEGIRAGEYDPSAPSTATVSDDFINQLKKTRGSKDGTESDLDSDKGRKTRSFAQRLSDQIENRKAEIAALTNTSSKSFDEKFELEGLDRVKRDYEAILTLRYELGMSLKEPLPKPDDRAAITALRDDLESAKRVYDAIKSIQQEARKASEELATAQAALSIPVLDAETRYQIEYTKLLRERRNEEAQLTADLKLQLQQRVDAESDAEESARQRRINRIRVVSDALRAGSDARTAADQARIRRELYEGKGGNLFDLAETGVQSSPIVKISDNVQRIVEMMSGKAPASASAPAGVDSVNGDTFRIDTAGLDFNALRLKTLQDQVSTELDSLLPNLIDEVDKLRMTEEAYNDVALTGRRQQLEISKALYESQRDLRIQTEATTVEQQTLLQQQRELNDPSSARTKLVLAQAENDVIRTRIELQEASLRRESETTSRRLRAQDELSRKTVFDASQVKATVEEYAASAKGYNDIIADAFTSTADAIGNGIDNLIGKATSKLGFFGSLVGSIASQMLRLVSNQLILKLMNFMLGGNGGGQAAAAGGGGVGSVLFGGSGAGGGLGGFLTPGFGGGFPQLGGGSGSGGGMIGSLPFAGFVPNLGLRGPGQAVGGVAPASVGILGMLKNAAPLLGLSLGGSLGMGLGGQSKPGQLLGGLGGLAVGGGIAALLAPGATTGLLGAGATALLSNPVTIAAGAALLVGAYFFGKAKQRKADEKTADGYWVEYKDRLIELTRGVKSNRIDGDEALSQAAQARQQAVDQIMTIKTKSVRESRLKNQIGDVDRVFLEPLKAAVADQRKRKDLDDRLVPEFAVGGRIPGRPGQASLAWLHGGELIVNMKQQTPELIAAAQNAGVPGVRGSNPTGGGSSQPQALYVELSLGTDTQNQLYVNGAKSPEGFRVMVQQTKNAKKAGSI